RPDPDSGRAHDRPRRGKRGDGAPGAGPPDGRQDLSHDHARPPLDHGCRLGGPAGRRPHHRPRHAQRADGAERPVPAPVRAQSRAAGGRSVPVKQSLPVPGRAPRAAVRRSGFPADPDFPQLAVARDPERMLELFRPHLRPVGFIPDLEMVVQVFPYDRKLRNLRLVLGGALRDLEPQLLARLAPGEWRVSERTMAPTRYRTELGAALKYTLQARDATTGRAETLRCFVKVYRNDHGEHAFELLESLGERVARGETCYSVVRPVAYRKDLRTLVLEEAPGTALQQLLREGHDPAGPLRSTARAVGALHQDDVGNRAVARSALAVQLEAMRRGAT